jgi:PAS domain S-box-containing protein
MIRYPIKILLVEDNADQVLLTEKAFRRYSTDVQIVAVRDGRGCVDLVSKDRFSAVIVDYHLPQMTGTEVIRKLRETGLQIPVIMVTGQGDEEVAVTAMKSGASDYVVKTQGYFRKLPAVIEKAIETCELQSRLKDSEDKYRRLAENANDLIFTIDRDGTFGFLTRRVGSLLGYSVEELIGRDIKEILTPDSRHKAEELFGSGQSTIGSNLVALDFVTKQGDHKSFEVSFTTLSQGSAIVGYEAIGRDFTQRLQLERQILQRNKELTTLLSVTSGVAHSLNIEEISTAALEKVCELADWSCGAISTLTFGDLSWQLSGSVNLPQPFVRSLGDEFFLADTRESLWRSRSCD